MDAHLVGPPTLEARARAAWSGRRVAPGVRRTGVGRPRRLAPAVTAILVGVRVDRPIGASTSPRSSADRARRPAPGSAAPSSASPAAPPRIGRRRRCGRQPAGPTCPCRAGARCPGRSAAHTPATDESARSGNAGAGRRPGCPRVARARVHHQSGRLVHHGHARRRRTPPRSARRVRPPRPAARPRAAATVSIAPSREGTRPDGTGAPSTWTAARLRPVRLPRPGRRRPPSRRPGPPGRRRGVAGISTT